MEALFVSQTLLAMLTLNGLILCPVSLFAWTAPPLAIPNVLLAAQTGSALLAVPTTSLMRYSSVPQIQTALLPLISILIFPLPSTPAKTVHSKLLTALHATQPDSAALALRATLSMLRYSPAPQTQSALLVVSILTLLPVPPTPAKTVQPKLLTVLHAAQPDSAALALRATLLMMRYSPVPQIQSALLIVSILILPLPPTLAKTVHSKLLTALHATQPDSAALAQRATLSMLRYSPVPQIQSALLVVILILPLPPIPAKPVQPKLQTVLNATQNRVFALLAALDTIWIATRANSARALSMELAPSVIHAPLEITSMEQNVQLAQA